ncbi:alpha-L-rhamnosidase C-terminal domain-containing protein [Neobacillus bataviensis]|uniref:alpha-L-rhamnosidase C-terminal domain-containing protein n=1 Tax=Neobacillus bataviensis TaxID=220685 RepID=UPI0021BD841F|nr:alpha-L-rhamnosidase C-terminal domain-containing protein [Neobacillus bataviensis]
MLQPTIDNDKRITWAKGSFDSVYGTIKSEWEVKNGTLTYDATIPANTTATTNTQLVDSSIVFIFIICLGTFPNSFAF